MRRMVPAKPVEPAQAAVLATNGPGGTLTLFVSIQVEGVGSIPIFAGGRFPKLRLTSVDKKTSYEMWLADVVIRVPRNYTAVPDLYNVSIDDLPDGFAVKSITYRADEAGLRFEDVLRGTLKISSRANFEVHAGTLDAIAAPDLPITITLTRTSRSAPSGVRITGISEGVIVEKRVPRVGGDMRDFRTNMLDAAIHLSGQPGILYADGSFEFVGVSPGLHSIILQTTPPRFAVAQVAVRNRDLPGIKLQTVEVLPKDVARPAAPVVGADGVQPLTSISGRILNEATQQPVGFGYVTLTGSAGAIRTYVGGRNDAFRFSNLLPGQYSLTTDVTGYKSATQEITVGSDPLQLDIPIARNP
jgi:hypothetical protein